VGNILILLKMKVGIPLAITGIALSIIKCGWLVWIVIRIPSPSFMYEANSKVISLLFWVCWLILYGIVVRKAAKKLGCPRRNASPEERAV